MPTKLSDIINPQVMGDMIDAKIEAQLKITPYAKVDTSLQGVPGDTKTVPSWNYIGDAEDFDPESGNEIETTKLTASSTTFTIKCAMKSVGIFQTSINSGLGDPVGQAETQLSKSIAGKADNDVLAAAYTSKNVVAPTTLATIELCAYLCKTYNIPVNNIVSHHEAGQRGMGSQHIDPDNWWSRHGYTMDKFRAAVKAKLEPPVLDKAGYKKGDNTIGVLALKELLLLAKSVGINKYGMYKDRVVGGGTVNAINYLLGKWGYKQNGIAGEQFIKRLHTEIDKKVK